MLILSTRDPPDLVNMVTFFVAKIRMHWAKFKEITSRCETATGDLKCLSEFLDYMETKV
jgi:hypothetical protein